MISSEAEWFSTPVYPEAFIPGPTGAVVEVGAEHQHVVLVLARPVRDKVVSDRSALFQRVDASHETRGVPCGLHVVDRRREPRRFACPVAAVLISDRLKLRRRGTMSW